MSNKKKNRIFEIGKSDDFSVEKKTKRMNEMNHDRKQVDIIEIWD